MKRSTPWTTALAVAALLAMPAGGWAQSGSSSQPPTTQPPTTQPPTTQPPTTQPPTGQPPATTEPADPGQVDADAARQHLTEARETLSQLTQLPAATQLSGEARTQVSQLIANFNELITTQADWQASYAKVEANLTSLIGPEDPAAAATTNPANPANPANPTGTAGAVGTSGTSGTVDIDPTIREKLVELRAKLNEFERAAGAASAAGDPAAASTMTGAHPTGTPPETTPQDPAAAQSPQTDNTEALRHILAIEAILNSAGAAPGTAGTSGTTPPPAGTQTPTTTGAPVSLDRAQIEQLRTHINALKRIIEAK